MKNIVLVFVIAFAFCSMAMASDIAISTQANWWGQAAADAEMQEIVDNVTAVSVERFTANEQDALAAWVVDHTGDGTVDLLILCGTFPDTIYEPGNVQADDSLAELFLDDGNTIINTGDYLFYVVNGAGTNGEGGIQTMMDIAGITMWDDDTAVVVTAEGQEFTPTLVDFATDRPFHLDELEGDWEAELILAQNTAGTRADPIIVHNTVTNGRIGIFYQTSSQDDDPRGEVISEWINNWFLIYVAGGNPFARSPSPKNGAMHTETWASMSWIAGDFAASHDVYFGDNFDDVNDGAGDTFQGNQTLLYFVAGFAGYPYPDGLVNGNTYYWRIDEVNDADPNSPWKGNVWSFWIPSKKAYDPVPGDSSKFIDSENLILSWTSGLGAALHTVYFGDDFDTVANATVGTLQGVTNFSPGPLESDKTYFWRVDETETLGTHTGDVWSFKTLPNIAVTDPNLVGWWKLDEGPGNIAVDWSGHGNHATLQGDPEWVEGYDGGALQCDGNGDWATTGIMPADFGLDGGNPKTVTAWVYTTGFNNGGIYDMGSQSDGQEFCLRTLATVDNWRAQRWGYPTYDFDVVYPSENRWVHFAQVYENNFTIVYANGVSIGTQSVTLDTANAAFVIGRYGGSTGFDGIIDDLRLFNKALTQDEVKETMRGDPALAWNANPINGSTPYIKDATPLSWSPGENASQHDVYFGTDKNAVDNADASDTTGIYRGRQSATTYTPPEGVEWGGGPYYWRIDQVNTDGTIGTGRIWTFTVADFILVDDFEDYNVGDNQIWFAWHDGLGAGTPGLDPYVPSNGTGSMIGDDTTNSYTEETIVHGGGKSMPYWYDNNKQGFARYSEAELTLTARRDWTEEGVTELSLWFRGYPASVGSFVEAPVGTFTMTGSGTDIWGTADEYHYAYKTLTGVGTIQAKVLSMDNTHDWAKAGVMIRETLDPGSVHASMVVTPAQGVSFQRRPGTDAASTSDNSATLAETAPYWVKIERDLAGNFTASSSTNGSTWTMLGTPQNIAMGSNVYIGLAVTSHDAALTCQTVFSNVTTTGTVSPQWVHQDIGIESNAAEPLYVAVSNSAGTPAVVVHDDPAAATIDTWTEWIIPLQAFEDQGIVLTNVDRIAIGLGTKGNMTIPGGSGKMYFDDIRLYQPEPEPEPEP